MANTRRENRLEELGRVDAEKAFTRKGKRNLRDEKSRIRGELKGGGIAKRGLGKAFRGGGFSLMTKDWQIGSGYVQEPKIKKDPWSGKDGYAVKLQKLKQLIQQNLKRLL